MENDLLMLKYEQTVTASNTSGLLKYNSHVFGVFQFTLLHRLSP